MFYVPVGAQDGKISPTRTALQKSGSGAGCQPGIASADLDINNVRARLFNIGNFFSRGVQPTFYRVPKSGTGEAIFAMSIWISGEIEGELALTASDYGPWVYWPGPLDDNGRPPDDCSQYDRLYKVSRQDIADYRDTGTPSSDLADWPFKLGAPVIDGDGNPDNYDLAGGDRPEILGDQTIWWVMNDLGNVHQWAEGAPVPIGIEAQVTAFAFKRADALNNTTFYRYKILKKGGKPVTDTYFSIWLDPDLGDRSDDYVGSDTTLGIGFVWNGEDYDEGVNGYRDRPPALGVDFFKGPTADPDGIDNDDDGEIDEAGETLAMTSFVYYNNDGLQRTPTGNPWTAEDVNQYQRSIWRDKTPITYGGTGYGFSEIQAPFMFPGEPGVYWSEDNTDDEGTANDPGDRRFLMTAGPFTLEPGDEQTIFFGIVWAQGADRFDSVKKMKEADILAQQAFDVGFQLPEIPDAPRVDVGEMDETVFLTWGYRPSDNNYLDQYEVENLFLKDLDVEDKTYNFEGYIVYEFESDVAESGEIVATYDLVNGVTRIVDVIDATTNIPIADISVDGTDSGVRHSIEFKELDNYRDYHFGIQAYAYNEYSAPLILKSAITRVTVRPSKVLARDGGTVINYDASDQDLTVDNGRVIKEALGGGIVEATVIDPSAVTGNMYRIEFFEEQPEDGPRKVTNYSVVDATRNEVIVDGHSAVSSLESMPQGRDIFVADGLSWTVLGPPPEFLGADQRASAMSDEVTDGNLILNLNAAEQRGAGATAFYLDAQGGGGSPAGVLNRIDWLGNIAGNAPLEYELRFVDDPEEDGQVAISAWTDGRTDGYDFLMRGWIESAGGRFGEDASMDTVRKDVGRLPFQFWSIDPTSDIETQVVFGILDDDNDGYWAPFRTDGSFALFEDGGRSYERIYVTTIPYDEEALLQDPTDVSTQNVFWECFPVCHTIGRLLVSMGGLGVQREQASALEEALELIAVVPNPYKGVSDYEVSGLEDVVRFTNMPQRATIRIFTLAGTLIKMILKDGPSTSVDWDLRTDEGLPIGSGMYLIHIEVPDVGDRVIKFGAVKKRPHIELF
jgi:hypothetical protein